MIQNRMSLPSQLRTLGQKAILCGKSSAQTVAASTNTVVAFNLAKFPATGGLVLESGTVTVPVEGWYQVSGNVSFASSTSSARRILWVDKGPTPGNLTAFYAATIVAAAQDTANTTTLTASSLVYASAGEVLGLGVHVLTSWALDVSQAYMHALSVHYVGA